MSKKLSELFHLCAYDIKYTNVKDWVSYAFLEEKDSLYIFFQGSCQPQDWYANFAFKRRPYKDMQIPYRVHGGFLKAWKEVEDIIIAKICEDDDKGYKWKHITIVGYSHGGALCQFCVECIWYWRPDLRENGFEGYGFESPRMYGCMFVKKSLKERWANYTLIRCNNDLVTHCPPRLFGFTHVGQLLKIKGNTKLVDNKWIPRCVKSHYPQVVYDALLKYEEEQD